MQVATITVMESVLKRQANAWLRILIVIGILLNGAWVAANVGKLRDYGSFIAAGKALALGDDPYGSYEDTFRARYDGVSFDSPNLNPPVSVYPFRALASFDPYAGKAVVNTVSVLLFAGVIAALMRAYPEKRTPMVALWCLSLAGFWHAIELGQIYIPLLAAVTAAWLLQDRRPLLAGILIGLAVAMKPNFVVWPLLLLLGGDRRTSIGALTTAAGISAIPLVLAGPEIYRQWLDASRAFPGLELPGNSAIVAIFARAGLEEAGLAVSAAVVLALAGWAWKFRPSKHELSAAGILGTLLLGPISWAGYSLFALPILFSRPWGGWERAVAVSLAFPFWAVLLLMPINSLTHFLVGPVYGWGLLILGALMAGDTYRRLRARHEAAATGFEEQRAALAA